MLKKILLVSTLSLILVGCGSTPASNKSVSNMKTVDQVVQEQTQAADAATVADTQVSISADITTSAPVKFKTSENDKSYETADLDLTNMSSTLVYSEIFNITNTPDDYVGKVIKVSGNLGSFYDETDGNTYLACVNQDAAACCAQGIEFQPSTSDLDKLDMENGGQVTVIGTYGTYDINGQKYYALLDADVVDFQ